VPRSKLACGRVGDDGDGVAVQPGRPVLRLLLALAACMGRQLVSLHGAGNRSPTRHGGGARAACRGPRLSRSRGGLCEVETSRARRRLVVRGGNLSEGTPLVGN
jgi:hypothetical protein